MKTLYTAAATAQGGRDGHVRSADGLLELDLRVPKEMGGPGGSGSNPEQLFAAGYAACFESALRTVARVEKKPLSEARVTAEVSFNVTDDHKYILSVVLRAEVKDLPPDEILSLMHRAHEVCPYSNATRGNIQVDLRAG